MPETGLALKTETGLQTAEHSPAITERLARLEVIQAQRHFLEHVKAMMVKGTHFDKIPGVEKDTLKLEGAELLGTSFELVATPEVSMTEIVMEGIPAGHREYQVKTLLHHVETGIFVGAGFGSCSTLESKYRWRYGDSESSGIPVPRDYWKKRDIEILKAAAPHFKKPRATKIDGQWEVVEGVRMENPDIADSWHTVLMMAQKRSYVKAIRTATGASIYFTQDVEDMPQFQREQPQDAQAEVIDDNAQAQATQPAAATQAKANGNGAKVPKSAKAYSEAKDRLVEKISSLLEDFGTGQIQMAELDKWHGQAKDWILKWGAKKHRDEALALLSGMMGTVAEMTGNAYPK